MKGALNLAQASVVEIPTWMGRSPGQAQRYTESYWIKQTFTQG
ncbi:MAG: hypothetical protein ACFCA4_11725 [Cyanophyceae cyanobacterium]